MVARLLERRGTWLVPWRHTSGSQWVLAKDSSLRRRTTGRKTHHGGRAPEYRQRAVLGSRERAVWSNARVSLPSRHKQLRNPTHWNPHPRRTIVQLIRQLVKRLF